MRKVTTVIISSLLAIMILPGITVPPASAAVDETDLLSNHVERLQPRFRAFVLQPMDRDDYLSQAESGRMTLLLLGKPFDVVLHEVQVEDEGLVPMLQLDGTTFVPDPGYDFRSRFFRGHVAGFPESQALMTITKIGVDGFVRAGADWIQFEPLAGLYKDAPYGVSVVYRTEDLIRKSGAFDPHEELPPVEPAAENGGGGISLLSSHTNPYVRIVGDNEFYTAYGAGWSSKMSSVMGRVASVYSSQLGWTVTVQAYSTCSSAQCNTDTGRTSTDATTLRSAYASYEQTLRGQLGLTWNLNHLFTGKTLDSSVIGIGYLAGRYGVSMMVNNDDYDGGSTDYEAGVLVLHETGHNFAATHDDASSTHWHGVTPFTHYYIMVTSWSHEPSEWKEQLEEHTSGSKTKMNACNDGTWAALSYNPGSYTCA